MLAIRHIFVSSKFCYKTERTIVKCAVKHCERMTGRDVHVYLAENEEGLGQCLEKKLRKPIRQSDLLILVLSGSEESHSDGSVSQVKQSAWVTWEYNMARRLDRWFYQRIPIQAFIKECDRSMYGDEEAALRAEVVRDLSPEWFRNNKDLYKEARKSVLSWMTGDFWFTKRLLHAISIAAAFALVGIILTIAFIYRVLVLYQPWIVVVLMMLLLFLAWFIKEEGGV